MKTFFIRLILIAVLIFPALVFAEATRPENLPSENPQVEIKTTFGSIVVRLNPSKAPKTVENFLAYAESGAYEHTIFHRVMQGFMVQGGGLTADMKRKATRNPVQNEADNGLLNKRGTIAMARTGDPHSATSQFFINTVDNAFLDHRGKNAKGWGYCVFGEVVGGMDVVDKIEKVPTTIRSGRKNVPEETIEILSVKVLETPPASKDNS